MKKKEIIVLAILALGLCLWSFWPKDAGNAVRVTVDGEPMMTLPLGEDSRTPISGYRAFSLTVVVEDGAVRVEDSNCPDLICQNHKPISRAGEQIVCLPHRLVISITGEEAQFDAVAG